MNPSPAGKCQQGLPTKLAQAQGKLARPPIPEWRAFGQNAFASHCFQYGIGSPSPALLGYWHIRCFGFPGQMKKG
jgi:hypothetical protein